MIIPTFFEIPMVLLTFLRIYRFFRSDCLLGSHEEVSSQVSSRLRDITLSWTFLQHSNGQTCFPDTSRIQWHSLATNRRRTQSSRSSNFSAMSSASTRMTIQPFSWSSKSLLLSRRYAVSSVAIEIDGEEQAGLVQEHGIHAGDKGPSTFIDSGKVSPDHLVRHRKQFSGRSGLAFRF